MSTNRPEFRPRSAGKSWLALTLAVILSSTFHVPALADNDNGNSGGDNGNGGGNGGGGGHSFTGTALNQYDVGDTVTFYINSQQYKNAAFTSFTEKVSSRHTIQEMIDQSLGMLEPPNPDIIPPVKIGDDINLNNGVLGQKQLAKEPYLSKLRDAECLYLPVIAGDQPFNQSRKVIGFIAVKVQSVEINQSGGMVESITCTLLRGLARGKDGELPTTGSSVNDAALSRLSPFTLKLRGNADT